MTKIKYKTPANEYDNILDRFTYWFSNWKELDEKVISRLIDLYLPDYKLYDDKGKLMDFRAYLLDKKDIKHYQKIGLIKKVRVDQSKIRKGFKRYVGMRGVNISKIKKK